MYFDNVCKVNNNGKISGYHKRGKYDGDKITYFINDEYGDTNNLKPIQSDKNNNKSSSKKKLDFKAMSDQDIIDHCEKQNEENYNLNLQIRIKSAIRDLINKKLEESDDVEESLLKDFRFAVANVNKFDPILTNAWWLKLRDLYLQ